MSTIMVVPSTNIYTNFLRSIAHYKDQGSVAMDKLKQNS